MAYTLTVRQSISVRGNENGNPNEISLHTGDILKNLKFWIVLNVAKNAHWQEPFFE